MMSALLIGLLSGCVTTTSNYCLIAAPMIFEDRKTVDLLAEEDIEHLRDVVIHNETYTAICG